MCNRLKLCPTHFCKGRKNFFPGGEAPPRKFTRKFWKGVLRLCRGLDIRKFAKTPLIFGVSYINLGSKPTRVPRGDRTGAPLLPAWLRGVKTGPYIDSRKKFHLFRKFRTPWKNHWFRNFVWIWSGLSPDSIQCSPLTFPVYFCGTLWQCWTNPSFCKS